MNNINIDVTGQGVVLAYAPYTASSNFCSHRFAAKLKEVPIPFSLMLRTEMHDYSAFL